MGTLVAWVLVRERFRGAAVLETVIDIPFALPTVVAGIVMLALYGSDSPVGVNLSASRAGLFVALLFVTLPFTVRTVQPVLLELDRDAEQAAASLGASPATVFRRIVLPQILPATVSGAALAFARAIGEYGSVVFISSCRSRPDRVVADLRQAAEQRHPPPGDPAGRRDRHRVAVRQRRGAGRCSTCSNAGRPAVADVAAVATGAAATPTRPRAAPSAAAGVGVGLRTVAVLYVGLLVLVPVAVLCTGPSSRDWTSSGRPSDPDTQHAFQVTASSRRAVVINTVFGIGVAILLARYRFPRQAAARRARRPAGRGVADRGRPGAGAGLRPATAGSVDPWSACDFTSAEAGHGPRHGVRVPAAGRAGGRAGARPGRDRAGTGRRLARRQRRRAFPAHHAADDPGRADVRRRAVPRPLRRRVRRGAGRVTATSPGDNETAAVRVGNYTRPTRTRRLRGRLRADGDRHRRHRDRA